jgi:rhomboid family protein
VIPLRDENPTSRRPIVTIVLMVACVVAYLFVQPSPFGDDAEDVLFNYRHAVIPHELLTGDPQTECEVAVEVTDPTTAGQICDGPFANDRFARAKNVYLAVVTSLFLHGSLLHLGGNLLFLWVFGNNVEDRMGHWLFPLFFLAAGVVATLGQVLADPSSGVPLIGASGAVAGVMGAYFVWWPRARVLTLFWVVIVFWFRIPAAALLLAWLVLQFFTNPNSGVAWVAHVVGFAFGVGVGLLAGRPRPPEVSPAPLGLPPAPWPPPTA